MCPVLLEEGYKDTSAHAVMQTKPLDKRNIQLRNCFRGLVEEEKRPVNRNALKQVLVVVRRVKKA